MTLPIKLIVLSLLVAQCFCAKAQYANKLHNFYAEVLGAGGWGSINYARQFGPENRFGVRGGVGMYTDYETYVTVPIGVTYHWPLRKDSSAFLAAGIGATAFILPQNLFGANGAPGYSSYTNFVPSFAYQRNEKNGIFWRITVSGFFGGSYVPWIGVAIGFRK